MKPHNRPTKKQYELLEFIDDFVTTHGYGPSYREIMTGCNYSSVATVALHVNNLIQKGHLNKKDRSARSLEVVSPAKNTTAGKDESKERWLIGLIEDRFNIAGNSQNDQYADELAAIVRALKILGFTDAAEKFEKRLERPPQDTDNI